MRVHPSVRTAVRPYMKQDVLYKLAGVAELVYALRLERRVYRFDSCHQHWVDCGLGTAVRT